MNWSEFSLLYALLIVVMAGIGLTLYRFTKTAYQALLDSMSDAIVVLNRRRQITQLNLKARQIFALPATAVVGQPLETLLPETVKLLDPDVSHGDNEIVLGEGEDKRYYDCRVMPLHTRTGQFKGWLLVLRDITDARQIAESLRSQKELFESLVAVARATAEMPNLEATLHNALRVAARLTGAAHGSIILLDRNENLGRRLVILDHKTTSRKERLVKQIMTDGLAGWVAKNKRLALVGDIREDKRWLIDKDGPYNTRSALCAPILSGDNILGILTLTHIETGQFSDDHARLIQAAADQVSLAARNAQMYEELRSYAADLNTLYTIAQTVAQSLDIHETLAQTLELILGSLRFDMGLIYLADKGKGKEDAEELKLAVSQGIPDTILDMLQTEGTHETLATLALGRREIICVTDSQAEGEQVADFRLLAPRAFAIMDLIKTRAIISAPLMHQGRIVGVLSLLSRAPRTFTAEDTALYRAIGQQIATGVVNTHLFHQVVDERSQLQALIESSRDGIVLIGVNRKVLIVNTTGLTMLHLQSRPQAWLGRPFEHLTGHFHRHAPAAAEELEKEINRSLANQQLANNGDFELYDRRTYWLNLPVRSGGEPLGRLLLLRDVTQEHALERLRDDLIHTTVHDLRNPLTGIFSALEYLENDMVRGRLRSVPPGQETTSDNEPEISKHKNLVEIARSNARRMINLVNAILDINRLESEQMELEREIIPLSELTQDALDHQLPLALEKKIILKQDVPDNLPPTWADRNLIDRVLQNLIGNAIKFTPTGGEVRIVAQQMGTSKKQWLQLSVMDNGAGIPTQIQPRLFQRFATGGQKERGSGLGLVFCRMALKAHDEMIWAENNPQGGAVFHFTLPIAAE